VEYATRSLGRPLEWCIGRQPLAALTTPPGFLPRSSCEQLSSVGRAAVARAVLVLGVDPIGVAIPSFLRFPLRLGSAAQVCVFCECLNDYPVLHGFSWLARLCVSTCPLSLAPYWLGWIFAAGRAIACVWKRAFCGTREGNDASVCLMLIPPFAAASRLCRTA
jgi:hypothetical protein